MAKTKKRKSGRKPTKTTIPKLYIAAAVIAERVITEPDPSGPAGKNVVVPTVMRIVDKTTIAIDPSSVKYGDLLSLNLTALIIIKSADFSGAVVLSIDRINPANEREEIGPASTLFLDQFAGWNVTMPVQIKWAGEGYYWFEVAINGTMKRYMHIHVLLPKAGQK